jgi:hypothetical protein
MNLLGRALVEQCWTRLDDCPVLEVNLPVRPASLSLGCFASGSFNRSTNREHSARRVGFSVEEDRDTHTHSPGEGKTSDAGAMGSPSWTRPGARSHTGVDETRRSVETSRDGQGARRRSRCPERGAHPYAFRPRGPPASAPPPRK